MSESYPVTIASGKYSSMIARVRSNLLAVKSGRSSRRRAIHLHGSWRSKADGTNTGRPDAEENRGGWRDNRTLASSNAVIR